MSRQELEKRKERAAAETFVIAKTDGGYRIHSPTGGGGPYHVNPDAPSCTCKDFEGHRSDPEWRCKHILAVFGRYGAPANAADPDDEYEAAERAAIRAEAEKPDVRSVLTPKGATQMLIKRSVSPDGRIDSLSVEFSCPVDTLAKDVQTRALEILGVQDRIVRGFLRRENGNARRDERPVHDLDTPREEAEPAPEPNGAVAAQLLEISGMDTRKGRRLFITLKANGRTFKLFGTRRELADHLTAAGYLSWAGNVREGVRLNLPCRITTKPSRDGRFQDVDTVLPPHRQRSRHS